MFMNIIRETSSLAIRIWKNTFLVFTCGAFLVCAYMQLSSDNFDGLIILFGLGCLIASAIGSLPVLIALYFILPLIKKIIRQLVQRIYALLFSFFLITLLYGLAFGLLFKSPFASYNSFTDFLQATGIATGCLFTASLLSIGISAKDVKSFFNYQIKIKNNMNTNEEAQELVQSEIPEKQEKTNSVLIKALIVGSLILIMLIPMSFIQGLVTERKDRQADAIKEVSSKWAGPQTISNPYLVIPYKDSTQLLYSKSEVTTKYLVLLPENTSLKGDLFPEIRKRSIYKIPLYRTDLNMQGYFDLGRIEKNIRPEDIIYPGIKICFGLKEFKGVEEAIRIKINDSLILMTPGIPVNTIDTLGLSAPVNINNSNLQGKLTYSLNLKIKGSEQIQFEPLSGNSDFSLKSSWPSPSFMGNQIPAERIVKDSGFTASWKFNEANLPFDLALKDKDISKNDLAFGVSMVQPTDGYLQTIRCVKYAILIIGLSFAIFFIVELMQKNPVHPIQYALVGLALAIYYTLLLSTSEFTDFGYAYLIAAVATVLLISFYAQSHFKNIKTASVFCGFLTMLYGFIYILIQLEDTALLVGSIALFIILATVMYITRKINWYKL